MRLACYFLVEEEDENEKEKYDDLNQGKLDVPDYDKPTKTEKKERQNPCKFLPNSTFPFFNSRLFFLNQLLTSRF